MTLYEMTEAAKQLYALLESDEIPEEAVEDTLAGLGVEDKLTDYVYVINQFAADADMCKAKERAGVFGLAVRKSEAVNVTNVDRLAPEYIRTKTTTEPDKTAIKKAIKGGLTVDGAVLEVRNSLQIK